VPGPLPAGAAEVWWAWVAKDLRAAARDLASIDYCFVHPRRTRAHHATCRHRDDLRGPQAGNGRRGQVNERCVRCGRQAAARRGFDNRRPGCRGSPPTTAAMPNVISRDAGFTDARGAVTGRAVAATNGLGNQQPPGALRQSLLTPIGPAPGWQREARRGRKPSIALFNHGPRRKRASKVKRHRCGPRHAQEGTVTLKPGAEFRSRWPLQRRPAAPRPSRRPGLRRDGKWVPPDARRCAAARGLAFAQREQLGRSGPSWQRQRSRCRRSDALRVTIWRRRCACRSAAGDRPLVDFPYAGRADRAPHLPLRYRAQSLSRPAQSSCRRC